MPTRYRKSVKLGAGMKLNLGKSGITSVSFGSGPLRQTVGTSGRRTTSLSIPGTGLSYQKRSGSTRARPAAPPPIPQAPKPGMFAPPIERKFYEGIEAHRRGDWDKARAAFQATTQMNTNAASPYLFGALIAGVQGDDATAVSWLEWVVQHGQLPDQLMTKYAPGMTVPIPITERITVRAPLATVGPALLLAEIYQSSDRLEDAIGLIQQLHEGAPHDQAISLSLADLLYADGDDDGVIELAVGVENESDLSLALLHLKAKALVRLGMGSAGITEFTNCLKKSSGRDAVLLRDIRYDRGAAYDDAGQAAKARADFEKVYAEDPGYLDVRERLAQ